MDFFNDIFHNLALLEFYFLNIIYILLYIDFILSIFFQHSNILTRASHHWCLASNIVLVLHRRCYLMCPLNRTFCVNHAYIIYTLRNMYRVSLMAMRFKVTESTTMYQLAPLLHFNVTSPCSGKRQNYVMCKEKVMYQCYQDNTHRHTHKHAYR